MDLTDRADPADNGQPIPDASLVVRAQGRQALHGLGPNAFLGADLWIAPAVGWLNLRGKPQRAAVGITLPCESVWRIRPDALQRYLDRFLDQRFADRAAVQQRLRAEVTEALWRGAVVQSSAGVRLLPGDASPSGMPADVDGLSLDRLDLECDAMSAGPELLASVTEEAPVTEVLSSRLLVVRDPASGLGEAASVQISYFGPQIDQAGLLRYLVGYRQQALAAPDAVERIFADIWRCCQPHQLAVDARFDGRMGWSLRVFRSSSPQALPRLW